jgi:hypothetical protein
MMNKGGRIHDVLVKFFLKLPENASQRIASHFVIEMDKKIAARAASMRSLGGRPGQTSPAAPRDEKEVRRYVVLRRLAGPSPTTASIGILVEDLQIADGFLSSLFYRMAFKDLSPLLTDDSLFIACMREIMREMADLMFAYYQVSDWHDQLEKRGYDAGNIQFFAQVRDRIEAGRIKFWEVCDRLQIIVRTLFCVCSRSCQACGIAPTG